MLCQSRGGGASVRPELTELSVAAVVLLDQHSCPSTLLELFLLMVTPELTLDKDGSLRHLLIKCILPYREEGLHSQNIFSQNIYTDKCWCLK